MQGAPAAEVVVLAVPDRAIAEVARALAERASSADEVWLHLSGVHAAALLRQPSAPHGPRSAGCMHPLVALAPGVDLRGAIAGVEGEPDAVAVAIRLAKDAGLEPHPIPADRALYHAAAVSVAGHATALFAQAMRVLTAAGFERDAARRALQPLFLSAAKNLEEGAPEAVITGPASRGDVATVALHLAALARLADPDVLLVYRALARTAVGLSAVALGPELAARLITLLRAP